MTSTFKWTSPGLPLLSLWQDLDSFNRHLGWSQIASVSISANPEQLLLLFNFVLNNTTLLSGKFSPFCTEVGPAYRRALGYAATELLASVEPIGNHDKQEIFNEINQQENL